jgi:membrane-associated protease RseP (regulator of RpoE activity)
MSEWDPLLIAGAAILLWWLGLYLLDKRKLLEKHNLSLAGPILMWKTQKGRALIDRIARPKRFWRFFGDVSLVLVGLTMVATTALLLWEATLVQSAAVRANPPSPNLLLGLPGINPLIPVGYGIFGLAIAIVLHEFSHGILSRVANIKIRSLGGVFVIAPIGAFVEPDEDELRALPRHDRARLYAAGPATNIILAILFAVIFSTLMMSAVTPIHDGVGIVGYSGENSPAKLVHIPEYSIITSVNGIEVHTYAQFQAEMARVHPNQTITLTVYDSAGYHNFTLTTIPDSQDPQRPLIGIYGLDVSTDFYHPLSNPDRFGGIPYAILSYISLPFQGRAPIQDPAIRFYQINGPWSAIPAPLFWLLANTFYWLFWLNAMLGATNALPAVPLDGGYIFKDGLESLVTRVKRGIKTEDRDRIVKQVTYLFAFLILGLILWQMIGPRL